VTRDFFVSNTLPSDDVYITGVQRGDVRVFTVLVHAYAEGLTRFAYSFVGDMDVSHDIVQDVFARIWQLGAEWKPRVGVEAYVFSAVRNRALDVLRRRRTQKHAEEALRASMLWEAQADPYLDIALVRRLSEEFFSLTERQRDALRLRYGRGQTLAQIAQTLGIDLRATERLVTRAIVALRTRLARTGKELE
jgi:RNA polymerase sigma-70 factor (ECF subfamily)